MIKMIVFSQNQQHKINIIHPWASQFFFFQEGQRHCQSESSFAIMLFEAALKINNLNNQQVIKHYYRQQKVKGPPYSSALHTF